jgi:Asp-tRNA(Asn)/Glu-tRNA(Gln) amidotransferase B subunit
MAAFFEDAVAYGKSKGVSAKDIANAIVNGKLDLVDADSKLIVDDLIAKKASVVSDDSVIEKVAMEVIEENPDMVTSYKAGKIAVLQALIGQVMRKTQGKADAGKTREILEKLLS